MTKISTSKLSWQVSFGLYVFEQVYNNFTIKIIRLTEIDDFKTIRSL